MKTIYAAAALAVGLMTFAANAQEAPEVAGIVAGGTAHIQTGAKAAGTTGRATISTSVSESAMTTAPAKAVRGAKATQPKKGRERIELVSSERGAKKPVASAAGAAPANAKFGEIVSRYAAAYGVPVSLAHAVIRVESNYRVDARGRAGEVGLMQIKPATARGLGYSGSVKALYHPETNIKFGMKYLGMAHKLGGGSTCGTILKYNAGHGAKRMNPVSAAYCSKVKRHLASS